jgi:hypothetical protein
MGGKMDSEMEEVLGEEVESASERAACPGGLRSTGEFSEKHF